MASRTRLWIALSFGVLVLSAIAVWVHVASYPEHVPRSIARALDYFIEPGAAVWWLTIGKAFQAFPSDVPGYVVVSVGNTAVWMTAAAIVLMVARVGVRVAHRLTTRWSKRGTDKVPASITQQRVAQRGRYAPPTTRERRNNP
jgi:hypothetical protein